MPNRLSSSTLATILLLSGMSLPALSVPATAQVGLRIGFDFFHNRLARQGRWFRHPVWGDVWRPRPALVGAAFQPYTNGYWELTDEYGWYWVSDDPIDDVVYHYGRWVYDPMWHWLWVPGYTWAPAWVLWREGDDYTGWMPLPPDEEFISGSGPGFGMRLGPIGINFYRNWYGGRVDPDRFFVFVENRHLVQRDYRRFVVPRDRVKLVIGRTRPMTKFEVVNNRVVNRGVDVRVIERATGRRIAPVSAKVVIKPNAVVTTVNEAKQVRERERVAHPIDVNAVRRGNAGRGDGGTAAEPADRNMRGPGGPDATGNGRMSNPAGESMSGPPTERTGKTRGQDNDADNGRMRNPSGETMTGPSTDQPGKRGKRGNPSSTGEGNAANGDTGSPPSPDNPGAGSTRKHRGAKSNAGTSAEPSAPPGNGVDMESTTPKPRKRNTGAGGTDSSAGTGNPPPPIEAPAAEGPRPPRQSAQPATNAGSAGAEPKEKRKHKKAPETPASPQ